MTDTVFFPQTWSLKAKETPSPKHLTLKFRQKIFGLKFMYMCEPVCSPLEAFWSYFPITAKFDRVLLSFYGFCKNSIRQGNSSYQSFYLTFAKYQSSILGYIQPWNKTLIRKQALVVPLLTVLRTFLRISALVPSGAQTFSTLLTPLSLGSSLHISNLFLAQYCLCAQLFFTPRKCSRIFKSTLP